jgi:hypothetical protein
MESANMGPPIHTNTHREEQKVQISVLEREVSDLKTKLQAVEAGTSEGRGGSSLNSSCETAQNDRSVLPSGIKKGKFYSEVLRGNDGKRYKLTLRSKTGQSPESIKNFI